jgi:hypothetical protein
MNKSLLFIAGLAFSFSAFSQQQIGNGNMEAWGNVGSATEEPTNWNSFKTAFSGGLSGLAQQAVWRSTNVRPGATGTYCAQVKCVSIFGVAANGNLTLGRVNMGSSSAQDPANYNKSVTADVNFSEALTDTPDSLVFWVKYTNSNSAYQARLSAVLHDSYDYIDGYTVDAGSAPHKVGEISHNFNATGGVWVRKSLPWIYTGPAATNTFVLLTFATNKIPGTGTVGDELLIDDIELIYNPVNEAPVATDDVISTMQDQAVIIPILNNDSDLENDIDISSVTVVANPTNGTVSINSITGEITYTPATGFVGIDVFTYSVCDNGLPVLCDQATVTITVAQVISGNNPIIANDDVVITDMDVAVITNVVANDVDFENQINLSSLTVTVQPTNGTTSINNTTGEITYTPTLGYFGNDSYKYSICDAGTPSITCDEALVSVTVNLIWGITESTANSIQVKMMNQQISFESAEELAGTYTIYSANGILVQSGSIKPIVAFNNPSGIYFVHITTSKGTFTQKIANL